MTGKFDNETPAADLVSRLLGGTWELRDTGKVPMTHDFDINLRSGRVIALEVTSSATPELKSMWNAIGRRNWEAPRLSCTWTLILHQRAHGYEPTIKRLNKEAEGHLEALEEAGVQQFGMSGNLRIPSLKEVAAVQSLARLGVTMGMSVNSVKRPPTIVLGSGRGFVGESRILNQEIEKLVGENVDKLRRAVADERHLFVWLDWSDLGAQYVMMRNRIPEAPPQLPEDVDTVWVAPYAIRGKSPTDTPWLRLVTADGWTVADSPPNSYRTERQVNR